MTDERKTSGMNWKNLPNQITIGRIVLIFLFLLLANFDNENTNCIKVAESTAVICHWSAYIIAIIAGFSDFLDGYIARKYKLESDFGRLMDPLADKIFVLATFTMLVDYQLMPGWVLIIILAREFMVTGLRTLASAKGVVISADRWGKLKTFLQMITLLLGGLSWVHSGLFDIESGAWKAVWFVLLGIVTLVTVSSGLGYFIRYRKLFLDDMAA